jgi:hypothetical protein
MIQLSFRDPDGFLIQYEGKLFRVILNSWEDEMKLLNASFFTDFAIPNHYEIDESTYNLLLLELEKNGFEPSRILTILEVEELKLITYPWEWTPTMLVSAGIYVLNLQKKLMDYGLTLKDSSFLNIQFVGNQIYFIDLLSIKRATDFYPWIPYGQFLRHFIYPSSLIKYNKIINLKLLWNYVDGIDFEHTYKILPRRTIFNFFELFHFTIASLILKTKTTPPGNKLVTGLKSKTNLNNLLDWNICYLQDLKSKLLKRNSYWAEYYSRDVSSEYYKQKTIAIKQLMSQIEPGGRVLDIGSNTGEYSEPFLNYFNELICIERDTVCCEILRAKISENMPYAADKIWHVINSDIVNPDPALGWMNKERKSLLSRTKSNLVSVLGLTHHLYFTDSIDFNQQVYLFDVLTIKYLMVEFILADDDKVKIISLNNLTRLQDYNRDNFLKAYLTRFNLLRKIEINSTREIFLFEKNYPQNDK